MRRDWGLSALIVALILVICGLAASFVVRPYLLAGLEVPAPPPAIPLPVAEAPRVEQSVRPTSPAAAPPSASGGPVSASGGPESESAPSMASPAEPSSRDSSPPGPSPAASTSAAPASPDPTPSAPRADPAKSHALKANAVRANAVFNNPKAGNARRAAIENHIVSLINRAPRGSVISVAMYQFSSPRLAAALVGAARRRVAVRVVVDHKSVRFPAHRLLRNGLGADPGRPSWVVTCPPRRGCLGVPQRGLRAINHNKFFLFSATSGRTNVVVQTSANATPAARDRQWNDALTIQDRDVYKAYREYFNDLSTPRADGEYHRSTVAGRYLLLFSPWPSRNPVVDVLNDVSCQTPARIQVAMTRFSNRKIARKLARLRQEGCGVEVVHGKARKAVRGILTRSGVPIRRLHKGRKNGLVHSKYMLIDAVHRGVRQRIVLTGSGNYTRSGLHANDEVIVGVSDRALYARYLANFRLLSQMASGGVLP